MTTRFLIAVLSFVIAAPAYAGSKTAIFPFILVTPVQEEDFFLGTKKTSPEEEARLKLVHQEFTKLVTANGTYDAVDLAPLAAEIEAKMPINECNGCEIDLAKKSGADTAFIIVVEKASNTVLNLSVSELDVEKQGIKRNVMAVIQGNTDDAWLGGVRWIVKNRILMPQKASAP